MVPRLFLTLAAALLGLLGPSSITAQSAAQRGVLDAFRDSLAARTDTAGLAQLEAELMRAAQARRDDPLLHLRLGFLSLRLGDLGQVRYYDDAAAEFQWAVDLQPSWPYGWFALGLAEYELGAREGPAAERTTMLGRDASTRAATAWMRAALADPAFAARLEVLAAQAVRRRDSARASVVLDALRRAIASQPAGTRAPAILLALGRVEREVGDLPAALNAFETYRRLGDNRAVGLLEVARTRFLLGQREGAEAYYEGAAHDDLMALGAYRADLEMIATDSVLALFDGLRGRARAELLASFWGRRDRLDFRPEGSRLQEHYRRLAHARRHYSTGGWSLPSDPLFLRTEAVLDDRGRLYVRHGEPDARASLNSVGVEPNESWQYRRPGGDLVFHFVARQDPGRFRLVESLLDVVDMRSAMARGEASPGGRQPSSAASEQLLRSRESFASVYADLGGPRGERAADSEQRERERALVHGSLAVGLSTDSHEPRYPRELAARLHAVTTTRRSAGPLLHLLVAVPGFGLEPETVEAGFAYPMRLRVVGLDLEGRTRVEVDTVLRLTSPSAVRPERYLQTHVDIPLPEPLTLVYRMALEVGVTGGSVSAIDTVRAVPSDSPVPRLGDLVLGPPTSRTQHEGIALGPMQSVSRSERVQLYTEVAGISAQGRYSAVFELRDPDTDRLVVARRFSGRMPDGSGAINRTLSLSGVPPGRYVARLVLTDPERGPVERRQRVQVTIP